MADLSIERAGLHKHGVEESPGGKTNEKHYRQQIQLVTFVGLLFIDVVNNQLLIKAYAQNRGRQAASSSRLSSIQIKPHSMAAMTCCASDVSTISSPA